MTKRTEPNRCRLVLIAPPAINAADDEKRIVAALSGGDVASLILPAYDQDETAFQQRAERLVPLAQEKGVAVMIAGEARIAARAKADGIHFDGSKADLADTIEKYQAQMMIGCDGGKTRDGALELGETRPDYMFFGRFGYDTKPEPHTRNLGLGEWWAQMIQIPCIVLGGADIASVEAVAATGADFVALDAAIFSESADPAAKVAEANAILDEKAPAFGGSKR